MLSYTPFLPSQCWSSNLCASVPLCSTFIIKIRFSSSLLSGTLLLPRGRHCTIVPDIVHHLSWAQVLITLCDATDEFAQRTGRCMKWYTNDVSASSLGKHAGRTMLHHCDEGTPPNEQRAVSQPELKRKPVTMPMCWWRIYILYFYPTWLSLSTTTASAADATTTNYLLELLVLLLLLKKKRVDKWNKHKYSWSVCTVVEDTTN